MNCLALSFAGHRLVLNELSKRYSSFEVSFHLSLVTVIAIFCSFKSSLSFQFKIPGQPLSRGTVCDPKHLGFGPGGGGHLEI